MYRFATKKNLKRTVSVQNVIWSIVCAKACQMPAITTSFHSILLGLDKISNSCMACNTCEPASVEWHCQSFNAIAIYTLCLTLHTSCNSYEGYWGYRLHSLMWNHLSCQIKGLHISLRSGFNQKVNTIQGVYSKIA